VNEIKYARSGDDVFVAYEVIGDGARDLILIMEGFVPIDMMDAEPHMARAMRRLASFSRLIRFDRRGTGFSDPISPHDPPTLEQWVEDALAVMDAVGSREAAVYSSVEFSPTALLFAATHPDRVSALVLVNGFARAIHANDYPIGLPRQVLDDLIANTEPREGEPVIDDVAEFAPSVANDPEFRRWWQEAGRRGASPATARALLRVALESDVRSVLPLVQAPVLLPTLKDDISYDGAKYLADQLPNAKFVPLPGRDNFWWSADSADQVLDEIEEFLTGMRGGASAERVLATVLFTDIVDSTATSSALGDRKWRELLDHHDAATRRQITRFRGREIKNTGDGFLATFDGPARAIDCAHAIRDSARQLGIEVRSGVHTGEVEVRGDDIGGIGVHIAARVAAKAQSGTVWVSRTVADLVVGSGLEFEDRGEFELKGVPGPWRLFEVKLP
jgi:class 3 adenylate cyclase